MTKTEPYDVLYRASADTKPALFKCMATSISDARAQCEAAFPGCIVVVVR